MARGDIVVRLIGDPSSLKKGLKESETGLLTFEGATKKTHMALSSLVTGMVGAGGVVFGLEKMIEAAKGAQESQDHLAATMKDAGLSYDANKRSIEAVITKQSELAGFQKTDVRETYGALIRQTKDVTQANSDLALAVDIARGRHIDLATAQQIVIKANMGMVGQLKRMGIEISPVKDAMNALTDSHLKFTTAQKDAAKALDLAATKQKAIALLQQTYAGQAEAYGKSSAGAADRFKVSLTNLEVTLGTALLPTLTAGLKHVTAWVTKLNDSGDAAKYANEAASVIKGTIHDLTPVVKTGAGAFQSLADALGGDKQAVEALAGAFTAYKLAGAIGGIGASAGGSASKVGLLTSRLKTLGAIGVVAVEIDVFQKFLKDPSNKRHSFIQDLALLGPTMAVGGYDALFGGGGKSRTSAGATTGVAPQTGSAGKDQGAAIAATAATQLGISYQWGGPAILGQHTDCSGLAQAVLAKNGIHVGRTTYQQWTEGRAVMPGDLQPGDLVFFEPGPQGPNHVGIYIGNDQFIEDPHTGSSVRVSKLSTYPGFVGARRYTSVTSSAATAGPQTGGTTGSVADIIAGGKGKKPPVLTGSKLLSAGVQMALARAAGTKGTADDLSALERAKTELLGMPQSLAVTKELANVEKQIHHIQETNLKAHLAIQTAEWKKHAADVAASLKAQDAAWKVHIQQLQSGAADAKRIFDRSFGEASNALFKQFDRLTQMGLTSLDSERQQLTPSEQKLADAARQRAKLSNDRALQTAEIGLKSAGLDVTNLPSETADWSQLTDQQQSALDSYYQALNAVNDAQLQEQATTERKARDKEYADKAQAYQDQRDLDRQKLQDWLDDQKTYLDAGKTTWDLFYADLQKKAKDGGWDIGSAFWDAWNAAAAANTSAAQASNQASSAASGPSGDVGGFYQVIQQMLAAGTMSSAQAALYKSGHKLEIPGFASGVTNFRGGLALVGENGPEIASLAPGTSITPNGAALTADVPVIVQVGDEQLFRVMQRVTLRNKLRNGKNGLG